MHKTATVTRCFIVIYCRECSFRSSPQTSEVFWGKRVLKICSRFTGEHSCWTLLKSHFGMDLLLEICSIISEHLFRRTPMEDCFCSFYFKLPWLYKGISLHYDVSFLVFRFTVNWKRSILQSWINKGCEFLKKLPFLPFWIC